MTTKGVQSKGSRCPLQAFLQSRLVFLCERLHTFFPFAYSIFNLVFNLGSCQTGYVFGTHNTHWRHYQVKRHQSRARFAGNGLSSAIRAEKFHTGDANLTRIQASLLNGSLQWFQNRLEFSLFFKLCTHWTPFPDFAALFRLKREKEKRSYIHALFYRLSQNGRQDVHTIFYVNGVIKLYKKMPFL